MNNKRIQSILLPLVLAVVALLFACKQDPATSQKRTNKLNVRLEAEVTKINPLLKSPAYARYIATNVFQTLADFEPTGTEMFPILIKSIPQPHTATEGKFKGLLAYDFELREEAKWDNGTPITAKDIEFSYKLVLNPLNVSPFYSYMELLRGFSIDPSNPKKFTAYLSGYYFLGIESLCQMPVYPQYNYDPKGLMDGISLEDLAEPAKREALRTNQAIIDHAQFFQQAELNGTAATIVGSGAYKVDFIDKAQGVILVRKKDWWGNNLVNEHDFLGAFPDTIQYKLVLAEDAVINMLRTGELDIVANITPANYVKLKSDPDMSAKYDFAIQQAPIINRLMINNADPILSDVKVRQAIAYSVNYQELLTDIQMGMAQTAIGPIMEGSPAYASDIKPYTLDPDKARALLAEAGWSDTDNDGVADKIINGKKTPLVLQLFNTTGVGVGDLVSASLQTSMAKSGIKIDLKTMDINKITEETLNGRFQLASTAMSTQTGEIDLSQNYHSKALAPKGDNRVKFANAEMDAVIDKIKITSDKAERMKLFKQAQAILHEQVPEAYLYIPGFRIIKSKAFDFVLSPIRPGYKDVLSKLKKQPL